MKDLIFFGIQGSGKGTQGAIIAKEHDLTIFETGGALRSIASSGTELGNKVKEIIESGNLVTNSIVMDVIEDFLLNQAGEGAVLFDGIPRSMEQKETFDALLQKIDRDNFMGVWIDISEQESKNRLLNRRICQNCKKVFPAKYTEENCDACGGELVKRSDDNEKAILARIENFMKETLPAIEKYQEEGKIIRIDGEQSIEKVTEDIEKALTEIS